MIFLITCDILYIAMNMNYLNEFLILAHTLNFRQAAQKLFISQSSLSRHMEALENDLQTRLFNRTTQTVSLTETGKLLLKRAGALVDDYNDIRQQIEMIESNLSGYLRIGVPYYSISDYLGSIPTEFEQKFPDIRTEYVVDTPTDVHNNLVNNKVDVGFLVNYKMAYDSSLEYIPVYKERLGVVMNTQNPLTSKPYLLFSDLKDQRFLLLTDPFFISSMTQINELTRTFGGFVPENIKNYDRMESLLIGISKNEGICVSGELLKSHESNFVAYRPLIGPDCWRMVCICYNKENKNPEIQKFIDFYKSSDFYRIDK